MKFVTACRKVREGSVPIGTRKHGPAIIRDIDIGDHVIVNVAADGGNASLGKMNAGRCTAMLKRELELLDRRERIDLMHGAIIVREFDASIAGQQSDERHEGFGALIYDFFAGR